MLGDVSFPVVFVLFRSAPELSIFSGIVRLSCGFLLDCLAAMSLVSFFSFRPSARFPLLLVPCPLWRCHRRCRRSRRFACLPYRVMSSIVVIRFALPRFAPHRLVSSPRPPGRGRRGLVIDLRVRAAGRSACLSSFPCRSLAIARSLFSSVCVRLLRFVRDCVVVSVAVSSCIRYRMM